jgi:hypothetical protein
MPPAATYVQSQDSVGGLMNPGMKFTAVTPSDSTDLAFVSRGILVAVSGNVQIMGKNDSVTCVLFLAAGIIHPIMATRIYATNTSATGIVAVN